MPALQKRRGGFHIRPCRLRQGKLPRAHIECAPMDFVFAQMRPLSWPPLRGGSARRRWGREPCGSPEYFGSRLAKNLMGLLRPYGWFVGNGLDRSVPPCQKYDTAGKPRTAGWAEGSRPIPTNIPKSPHKTNGHGRPMVAPTHATEKKRAPFSTHEKPQPRCFVVKQRGCVLYFGSAYNSRL